MSETKSKPRPKVDRFSYESIMNSAWFSHIDRDILKSLLDPNKKYTNKECQSILKKEKGRVIA